MNLFVLGATGGIGRELTQQALARGHRVTAFVRSPHKINASSEHLSVIQGDVFNVDELARCMASHDVVLSAFGPASLRPSTLRRQFGKTVAAALRKGGVRRIQLVSAAFLFHELDILTRLLKATLFRQMIPDMAGMEAEICQPDLDWTIVRPPRLTNGPARHSYRINDGSLPSKGFLISRADVAHFMIKEAENPLHQKRIVGVAN